ncbi:cyclin-P4-1-like [Triticum urartu]|uniref:cyclin-P4-1-like n=1 Tax=Triticum urartu TaxID=4572 RepID=UPI002043E9B6|nr:cyclin-P4-1-like [Triticum urartu]
MKSSRENSRVHTHTGAQHPREPAIEIREASMGSAEEEDLPATDMPRVVGVLSALLERLTERNDTAAGPGALEPASRSAFRAMTKPGISVRAYMARIARFAGCSPACFVVGYIYLDRLLRRRRALAVDSYSVHRLLITTVLSAVKFMDDICYNNAYFAKVGGISLPEMNYLEVDFLFGVGFELNVSPETFGHYCAILQSEMLCLELEPEPLLPPNAAAPGSAMHCCLSEDDGTSATTSSSSSTQQQQLAA